MREEIFEEGDWYSLNSLHDFEFDDNLRRCHDRFGRVYEFDNQVILHDQLDILIRYSGRGRCLN